MVLRFELHEDHLDPSEWLDGLRDLYPDCASLYERPTAGHPHVLYVYPELKRNGKSRDDLQDHKLSRR